MKGEKKICQENRWEEVRQIKFSQDLVHTYDRSESALLNRLIVTPVAVVGKREGINMRIISMIVMCIGQ